MSRVAAAVAELRAGRMVILTGGAGREDEASLVLAAGSTSPQAVNFMAKEARGLICLALSAERCDELGLEPIRRPGGTTDGSLMVPIESREGVTTGISAHDRSRTVLTAIDPARGADDLVVPGHVLPLRARPGGILERPGQAEAAVELSRLAGGAPGALVCTILGADGSTAWGEELDLYAEHHGLAVVDVDELVAHHGSATVVDDAMRQAMGHFATGVTVVSSRDASGAMVGTTANAVSSVSLRPPLLLVCLARDSLTLAALRHSSRFAINVLAEHQHEQSIRFAAKGADADGGEHFSEHEEAGVPHLPGSLATIACRLEAVHVAGDHEIVIGEARSVATDAANPTPLVFFRGAYGSLAGEAPPLSAVG
jgi:3,4-dihydroxy-2-butanone 4-phosphate synthase